MLLADDLETTRIRTPWVTWGLMAVCTAIYLLQLSQPAVEDALALWPQEWRDGWRQPTQWQHLFGYMWLHGGWLHLAGNLLVLWVFGDNIEDALGHARMLLLYVLAGLAGGALHAVLGADPKTPLVGASGAIAGIMAAYLLLYPRAKLFVLAFARAPVLVPAGWFVAAWFATNAFEALTGGHGGEADVAWWAHIGGFLVGLALVGPLCQPGVALFQPAVVHPSPRFGWLRRVSFDFAPEAVPHAPGASGGHGWWDPQLAAIGKAAIFVLLMILGAWF